jgi:hypothetical protein
VGFSLIGTRKVVDIRFVSRQLRDRCCRRRQAVAHFGAVGALDLSRRLAQLDAIQRLEDLACMPVDLKEVDGRVISMTVRGSLRLLVHPVMEQGPATGLLAFEILDAGYEVGE